MKLQKCDRTGRSSQDTAATEEEKKKKCVRGVRNRGT